MVPAFEEFVGLPLARVEKVYLAHLAADDKGRYRRIPVVASAKTGQRDEILGRITGKINDQITLRTRTGKTITLDRWEVLDDNP